jgi:hypothetical protein
VGLLGLGAIGVLGGIGLEAAKLRNPRRPAELSDGVSGERSSAARDEVNGNRVNGNENAVGNDNLAIKAGQAVRVPGERRGAKNDVENNVVIGNGNAVGNGNVVGRSTSVPP